MTITDFLAQALSLRDVRDIQTRMQEDSDLWRVSKSLLKRLFVRVVVPRPKPGVPGRRRQIDGLIEDIRAFQFDWESSGGHSERLSVHVNVSRSICLPVSDVRLGLFRANTPCHATPQTRPSFWFEEAPYRYTR